MKIALYPMDTGLDFCKSGEKHFSSCIDWLCLQGAVNTGIERDLRSKSMSKAKPYECFLHKKSEPDDSPFF